MGEYKIIIFMFLTSVGLGLKIIAWFTALDIQNKPHYYYLVETLLHIQLLQSFGEFYAYLLDYEHWLANYAIRLYYLTTFISIILIPAISFEINGVKIKPLIKKIIYFSFLVIFILLYLSDLIIAGASHTGINLTRIAGPLYPVFQISVIFSLMLTTFTLIYYSTIKTGIARLAARNLSMSFFLYFSFFVFIIVAMVFMDGINATGFLPVFMGIFLLCLSKTINNNVALDLTYWLPFSKRRRLINRLIKPLITVSEDGVDIDVKKEYDAIVAEHALNLFRGNQTKAADWLHTSQPWVSRRSQR